MTVIVAGSTVALGDRLYSLRARATGTIVKLDPDVATFRVERDGRYRDYVVVNGGYVGGERDIYWHPPLTLDLPKGSENKLAKIQTIVNTVTNLL